TRLMQSWGAVAWGVAASAALALLGVRFVLGERRLGMLVASAAAALVAPLLWDLILRVFATALAAFVLGFGPLRADSGHPAALTSLVCGLAALLVDIYLYGERSLCREVDHP